MEGYGGDGTGESRNGNEKQQRIYRRRAAHTEGWAVGTCWDVVTAAQAFFQNVPLHPSSSTTTTTTMSPTFANMVGSTDDSDGGAQRRRLIEGFQPVHRAIVHSLCDSMNFARARLLRLGDLEFTPSNLIWRAMADRPEDTLVPWAPLWEEAVETGGGGAAAIGASVAAGDGRRALAGSGGGGGTDNDAGPTATTGTGTVVPRKNQSPWLHHSLQSERSFQRRYLQLTTVAVQLDLLAGRHRHAAHLRADTAEIHLLQGDHRLAVRNFLLAIDVDGDAEDGSGVWDTVRAWRLFRLACCQRAVLSSSSSDDGDDVMEYLRTLTHCFEPRLSPATTSAMPSKLRRLLQRDLEAIVGNPTIANRRHTLSPFLDVDIDLTMDSTTTTQSDDADLAVLEMNEVLGKKVLKTVCHVGETVVMEVFITNNLPNSIQVDSIKVLLSTVEDYEDAVQQQQHGKEETGDCNIITEEKEAFYVFHVKSVGDDDNDDNDNNKDDHSKSSSVIIHPGQNSYKILWIPMTVGQYILSSLDLRWKNAHFHHDPKRISPSSSSNQKKRNNILLGIDVHPSDPTQTIEINPIFLIPGHVQIVRLFFYAGEDIVTGGTAELTCSNGLRMRLASGSSGGGEDGGEWEDRCCVELGQCEPRAQIVLVVSVKSDAIDIDSHSLTDNDNRRGQPSQQTRDQRGGQGQGRQRYLSNDSADTYYPQILQAKVITFYHHGLYTKISASSGSTPPPPPMSAALEALVTTLERPALTVNRVVAIPYAKDRVMISVTVHCNTPVSFSLKEWDIYFPHPLCLDDEDEVKNGGGGGGDLNKGLFEKPVVEGEELFFGFKCRRIRRSCCPPGDKEYDDKNDDANKDNQGEILASSSNNSSQPVLHVTLKDEFDKTFRQVLPLDLDDLYSSMQREEEHLSVGMCASATLTCAAQQGLVGAPVSFTYRIDVITTVETKEQIIPSSSQHKQQQRQLLYQISCGRGDWIIGGKIRGSVDIVSSSLSSKEEEPSTSFDLNFVGVPSKAGVLKRFPDVELSYP